MSPKSLDFETMRQRCFDQMKAATQCVLATAVGDTVTARHISVVIIGEKLCFYTGTNTRKFGQIKENPRVALAMDNLQIEGTARFRGHPSEPENQDFVAAIIKRFEHEIPDNVDLTSSLLANPSVPFVVIEVSPARFQTYNLPPDFHMDIIDLEAGTAIRVDADDAPFLKMET
jgi:hypothetical protein